MTEDQQDQLDLEQEMAQEEASPEEAAPGEVQESVSAEQPVQGGRSGWIVAVAVIWLFVRNTTWRRGLLAVVSVGFAGLMIALSLSEQQAGPGAPLPTDRQLSEVRQSETIRYGAMKPSDIAISESALANTETIGTDPRAY